MTTNIKAIVLTTTLATVSEMVWVVQTWQGRITVILDTVFVNNASSGAIMIALKDLGLSNQITEIELGELTKIIPLLDVRDLSHRLHWIYMDVKRTESALSHLSDLLESATEPWATPVIAEIEALLA